MNCFLQTIQSFFSQPQDNHWFNYNLSVILRKNYVVNVCNLLDFYLKYNETQETTLKFNTQIFIL